MNENDVLDLAKTIANKNGWPWIEPIEISHSDSYISKRLWTVYSNASCIGCNIRIKINDDGTIVSAAFCSR